ncbi:MAG: PEP-CTERM sorting domain-containing protein, partial [Planctomycetota bacterium]
DDVSSVTEKACEAPAAIPDTTDRSSVGVFDAAWDVTVSDEDVAGATTTLLEDAIVASALVTFGGDANLDFAVDTADLALLAVNFGNAVAGWEQGDFTGDGLVGTDDLALLAVNFGNSAVPALGGLAAGVTAVPEPATAVLLLCGGAALGWRRRV